MTPEQALDLLDKAAAAVNADRKAHQAILEAVGVLRGVITRQSIDGSDKAS